MVKNYLFLFLMILIWGGDKGMAQCLEEDPFYQQGEFIAYEVAYNWGLIWVDAGKVYFKTETSQKEGKKYYNFVSYGRTYSFYDWFYKVRDRYVSTVRADGFIPEYFHRSTSEGGYKVENKFIYSPNEKRVHFSLYNNKSKLKQDSLELDNCAFDVLSAIYFIRSLNFDQFENDSTYPVDFLIDGQLYQLTIHQRDRQLVKTRNNKQYSCIRFTTALVGGTIFKEGEELTVWVSDDKNKLPILVEAKVLVGSIKAYLQEYKNLKEPLQSVD